MPQVWGQSTGWKHLWAPGLKTLAVSFQMKLSLVIKVALTKCQFAMGLSLNIPVIPKAKSPPQIVFRAHLSMDLKARGQIDTALEFFQEP